jgi:hypothetical protein
MKALLHRLLLACCMLGALFSGACASGPAVVDHAFGFDARVDSPGIEILNFRYGASGMPGTSGDVGIRQFGRSPQVTGINGPMPLGDTLTVKWRIKATGQEFEDTVNLKPRLPSDMANQRIHFSVKESQLFVYVIDPVPRPADWPVVGPRKFQYEKVRQIYPDAPGAPPQTLQKP